MRTKIYKSSDFYFFFFLTSGNWKPPKSLFLSKFWQFFSGNEIGGWAWLQPYPRPLLLGMSPTVGLYPTLKSMYWEPVFLCCVFFNWKHTCPLGEVAWHTQHTRHGWGYSMTFKVWSGRFNDFQKKIMFNRHNLITITSVWSSSEDYVI